MVAPRVSIIIPTCNRVKELAIGLRLLLPQIPSDGTVELLVCDDGGDEQTKRMLERDFSFATFVIWQQGPRRGPAANRNAGARAAQGEWLIFLDDDCEPRSDFLAAYLSQIKACTSKERIALEGATYRMEDSPSLLWEAPHNPEGGALISCNFAIPRRLYLEMGGFDERYPMASFEDTEFAARLQREGVGIVFVKGAAVDHPLRPLPPVLKLARRWEARAISTYDFGASTWQVFWKLPRHIALVILSRFREREFTRDNAKAALFFLGEFLLSVWYLPGWLRKYHSAPRSPFWSEQVAAGKAPPRFGL